MWFRLQISICQSSMVHEGCWVNFPTRVGNLEALIGCGRKSVRRIQLYSNQAAADHIRRVANSDDNIEKGEDVVLSQEDKQKCADQLVRFCVKLAFPIEVCTGQFTPAQMLQTTTCSATVWSQLHCPSHSLINNLVVCYKSCYCSFPNRKLNNK